MRRAPGRKGHTVITRRACHSAVLVMPATMKIGERAGRRRSSTLIPPRSEPASLRNDRGASP